MPQQQRSANSAKPNAPKGKSASKGKPSRQVHVAEEAEQLQDEEHEAFFVYAVLYRCPEVLLSSASTSQGHML